MRTARFVGAIAVTMGLTLFAVGCASAAPVNGPAVEDEVPAASSPVDVDDTIWIADGSGSPQGCVSHIVLRADGYVDHQAKCEGHEVFAGNRGVDDNSVWSLDGDRITISLNDGYNVCEGPATATLLDVRCVNQAPAEYPRRYVPTDVEPDPSRY